MDKERLEKLINKIYNEGLFYYTENEMKSNELIELEKMTSYENVKDLFYSDLAPKYVVDTIILYDEMKKGELDKKDYIKMIDEILININNIKEFEMDLYCMFLGKKIGIDDTEVFDTLLELSDQGLSSIEIYNKLLE